jgi:hypothetical protein
MLSLTCREGASARVRSGARALPLCLVLAGSLAAAPVAPPPPGGPTPSSSEPQPASASPSVADPDTILHRLADEMAQLDPSSPDAPARLRTALRDLIGVEQATRRELAALRAEVTALRTAVSRRAAVPASRRRTASEVPSAAGPSPVSGGAARPKFVAGSAPVAAAAGPLFGKRGLKKVHRSGCSFGERIRAEDRVTFSTMQDAVAAGYEACKVCRPE